MPLVELPIGWTVVVDALVWALLSVVIGYVAHRLPLTVVGRDGPVTRLRTFEADGRWYERRLAIRRWKPWLPEAGDFFRDGFDKSRLNRRDRSHLERFVAETRRAELTHWALLCCGPAFILWNPPLLAGAMVAFGVAANVPCLVAQRYNRARLQRVLSRRDGARRRR